MTAGEKIRKYRTDKGLSQKELAKMSGMSEPALRNYELGNRQPSEEQLEKIANALGISRFAISEPDLSSYQSVMHALFFLEDQYGLKPSFKEGILSLEIDMTSTLGKDVKGWSDERTELADGKITQEEYNQWKATYPAMKVQRQKEKRDKKREELK